MSQRPFPQAPPTEPLPEEVWLKQTDRSEVGREPFFFGRDAEYEVFRNALNSLHSGRIGGGTMIYQGAPGAGKTALMLECMESVKRHSTSNVPWVAVSIRPETLKSAVQTIRMIVNAVNTESERLSKVAPNTTAEKLESYLKLGRKLYRELSERGVGAAGFSVGGKPDAAGKLDSNLSSESVFTNSASLLRKFHLVVFVDEAQNTPVADTTRGVVDCLHNPPGNIPLVTVFFGLSDTQQVLRQCGLSRFADQRVVNLEPLSMDAAAGSFRRMLDAYFTGPEELRAVWVDALAKLSQGWPQHINRVGVAAGQVIRSNNGLLERSLLERALEKGTERKNDYYAGRLAAGSNPPWVYKQMALIAAEKQGALAGVLSDEEIDQLSETARKRREETIDEFLTNALHAGLLAPIIDLPFHYRFPISSLGDYLRALPVELPQLV